MIVNPQHCGTFSTAGATYHFAHTLPLNGADATLHAVSCLTPALGAKAIRHPTHFFDRSDGRVGLDLRPNHSEKMPDCRQSNCQVSTVKGLIECYGIVTTTVDVLPTLYS